MLFWVYKHTVFLPIIDFRQKMLMFTHHQLRGVNVQNYNSTEG